MSNRARNTTEIVYARRTAYDDVRVPMRVTLYWPDFTPRRIAAGVREYYKSAVAVLLVLASVGTSFGTIGFSGAFLSDSESSLGNTMQAQIHDFTGAVSPQSHPIDVGTPVTVPVDITPEPGTHNLYYRVSTDNFSGTMALCNAVTASLATPFVYNGDLMTLTGVSFVVPDLSFSISLPVANGLIAGNACTFDLVFHSWHALVPESTGYFDEERIAVTIVYTPPAPPPPEDLSDFNVVLNEYLPNPDSEANGLNLGDDSDSMPFGEWVELYNKGGQTVDVLNWYLEDQSGGGGNTHAVIGPSNTNTGSTLIAPGAWLVVYMNKPTLNNTGESIYLYSDDDMLIDSTSFDVPPPACFNDPTPGGENDVVPPTGTPGNGNSADCNQAHAPPNKSYARIPDGTGAWVDPVPTPGSVNIPEPVTEPEETL